MSLSELRACSIVGACLMAGDGLSMPATRSAHQEPMGERLRAR
jgi:hypothetical protein